MSEKMKIIKTDIDIESKKIIDSMLKKIFETYKNIPHNEMSQLDAYDNIEDLCEITEIIKRIIIRRNKYYLIEDEN